LAEDEKDDLTNEEASPAEGKKGSGEKEEKKTVLRNYPSNKYELAIVAAREARRLNEAWKDPEGRRAGRVTSKALERVLKGEVHYTIPEDEDN